FFVGFYLPKIAGSKLPITVMPCHPEFTPWLIMSCLQRFEYAYKVITRNVTEPEYFLKHHTFLTLFSTH
ncbi:MAG: hypothetical protein MJ001_07105, partial [Paludibacteraceae bacterium]|nr:hypothetical protein [Paludibacteraceae bacterium]